MQDETIISGKTSNKSLGLSALHGEKVKVSRLPFYCTPFHKASKGNYIEKHSDLLLHRPLNSWPRGGERKDGKALNSFLAFCLHTSLPSLHKQPPPEGVKQPSARLWQTLPCLHLSASSRQPGRRREHMRLKGEVGQGQN